RRSASQFIREIRLNRGMELLGGAGATVSEVAHQVGFSSTSYFIKCFREYYGYPPGEAGKRAGKTDLPVVVGHSERKTNPWIWAALATALVITLSITIYLTTRPAASAPREKSIAVLPF